MYRTLIYKKEIRTTIQTENIAERMPMMGEMWSKLGSMVASVMLMSAVFRDS